MLHPDRITVPQVFRLLNIEPTPDRTWAVGQRVQAMYAKEFGEQPPKDNRPKTYSPGVHCFALYPRGWQTKIESVIRQTVNDEGKQQNLF